MLFKHYSIPCLRTTHKVQMHRQQTKWYSLYVKCNFMVLCMEKRGWSEWVIRCLWSLLLNPGKCIYLIETTCPVLWNLSYPHTVHPWHNLLSSIPFITLFCNLSFWLPLSASAHTVLTPIDKKQTGVYLTLSTRKHRHCIYWIISKNVFIVYQEWSILFSVVSSRIVLSAHH